MSRQGQKQAHEYSSNHPTPTDIESQQTPAPATQAPSKGAEAFQAHYATVYGNRWPGLLTALRQEGVHEELGSPLRRSYYLDPASAEAAELLRPQPGMKVLDMCAAPGGKAMAMLRLFLSCHPEDTFEFTLNERSAARRARLQRVIHDSLPADARVSLRVTSHDARRWGLHEQNQYDIVMLDVPCSSERHLVHDPKSLQLWSPRRSKRLAMDAYAMLAAGLSALKAGGSLLYLTCALSPLENETVIMKAVERRGTEFTVLAPPTLTGAEPRRYGSIVLPDGAAGRGPLFATLIQKHP